MRQALVVLATLVMAGSPAWAQTTAPMERPVAPTAPPTPIEPGKVQPMAVEGKIKTLDQWNKTLTLEDGTALAIPESESAWMTGLKEGTRVIVSYLGIGEEKVVTSIIQIRESPKS